LPNGIRSQRAETRLASVQAAEAAAATHDLALATRRSPPENLQAFVAKLPAEDPLRTGMNALLPAIAGALEDESPAVRLTAAEAFENLGTDSRSQLGAVIRASQNDDLFVRWATTRALGRMLQSAPAEESKRIVNALVQRVEDSDLDVSTAALNALAKGGEAARPATVVVLRRATHGDPDTRILAIRTLEAIDADRATTVAGLIPVLSTDAPRVRKAAVIYLGRRGTRAMPAIPAIRKLLLDPDEEIRKEAAKAILSIEKGL
jgi:HEAT repeat protein